MARTVRWFSVGMVGMMIAGLLWALPGSAQERSRTFPETGKTVTGKFLDYWEKNGGLAQQGFPISEILWENSDVDGKHYAVQYFERAVFELHHENQPPYDVLLQLLGNFEYQKKYPTGAPNQRPNTSAGSVMFRETGKRLGGRFLEYWQRNGGLPQQGYPISDEFMERSDLDGKTYLVQYFERAVFEYHPENRPPYDVLLSQLGTFRYRQKYGSGGGTPAPPGGTPTPVRTATVPPQGETVLMTGSFDRQPNGYHASGQAQIVRQADGSMIVRLDIKEMTPGPDLFVWVTEHADPRNGDQMRQGGHDLGSLKGTSGVQTYRIPAGVDTTKIKSVVIYCRAARAIFSVAKLQPR